LADALGRESGLTLEDALEGVLTGRLRGSDGDLDVHQLGPGAVGVDAEGLDAVMDAHADVVHLRVELWDHH